MSLVHCSKNDFSNFMLDDWGQSLIVTHKSDSVFNPATGNYTDTTESSTINGIVQAISEKDQAIYPTIAQQAESKAHINLDDLAFVPANGDLVIYESRTYTVVEISSRYSLAILFLRRH